MKNVVRFDGTTLEVPDSEKLVQNSQANKFDNDKSIRVLLSKETLDTHKSLHFLRPFNTAQGPAVDVSSINDVNVEEFDPSKFQPSGEKLSEGSQFVVYTSKMMRGLRIVVNGNKRVVGYCNESKSLNSADECVLYGTNVSVSFSIRTLFCDLEHLDTVFYSISELLDSWRAK